MNLCIVSPYPEAMCAASIIEVEYQKVLFGGKHQVLNSVAELENEDALSHLFIFQYSVAEPGKLLRTLKELGRRGVAINWFAGSSNSGFSEAQIAKFPGKFFSGQNMVLSAGKYERTNKKQSSVLKAGLKRDDGELERFCRYFISRSLMRFPNADDLGKGIQFLSEYLGDTFSLKNLNPLLQRSIKRLAESDFPYLEGRSEKIKRLKSLLLKGAPTSMSALIIGETGTGKEAVALYLHEFSERKGGPFVALNCAGLNETFLKAELFGHTKEAFTGAATEKKGLVEEAHGGTLFLDELTETPLSVQAELLRFIQTKKYRRLGETKEREADVRFVAATQPTLFEKIKSGAFRPDLYYRIAEIELETPALKDNPGDIPYVTRHLIYALARKESIQLSATLQYFENRMDILKGHNWPGNVRELLTLIKKHVFLGVDIGEELERCRSSLKNGKTSETMETVPGKIVPLDVIKVAHVKKMREANPEMTKKYLARALGIAENTLNSYFRRGR